MVDKNMEIAMKGSLLVSLSISESLSDLTQTCCNIIIAINNLDRHHFRPTYQDLVHEYLLDAHDTHRVQRSYCRTQSDLKYDRGWSIYSEDSGTYGHSTFVLRLCINVGCSRL